MYVVLSAISFVFIDKVGSKIDPMLLLFMMVCISMLWFHAINIAKLKHIYSACLNDAWRFLWVMIFIGVNWLCSIYAPSNADPFIYLAANFVSQAMAGYIDNFIKTKTKVALISFALLAVSLVILYYNYHILAGRSVAIGIWLGVLGGFVGYFYSMLSARFQLKAQLSSTQVLAVRFWLLLIGLGLYLEYRHQVIRCSVTEFVTLVGMAFLCLIIPIYFLQQALKKNGAQFIAKYAARTPLVIFILYSLSQREFNLGNFMVCLIIMISLRSPELIKLMKKILRST